MNNVNGSQSTNVSQSTSTEKLSDNLGITTGLKAGEKNIDKSIQSLAPTILKDTATIKEKEVFTPLGIESEMLRHQNQPLSSPFLENDERLSDIQKQMALLKMEEEMDAEEADTDLEEDETDARIAQEDAETAQEYQRQLDEIDESLSNLSLAENPINLVENPSLAEKIEQEEVAEESGQQAVLEQTEVTNQKTHEKAIEIMSGAGKSNQPLEGTTPALRSHDITLREAQVQERAGTPDNAARAARPTTRSAPAPRSQAEAILIRKFEREADRIISNYQFRGKYSNLVKEMLREKIREHVKEVIVEDRSPEEIANDLANLFKPSSNHTYEFYVPSEEPSEVQQEVPNRELEQKPSKEKLLVLVPPSHAEQYKDLHKADKDNVVIRDGKEFHVEVHYLSEKEHEEMQSDMANFAELVNNLSAMLTVAKKENAKKDEKEEAVKQSPDTEALKTPEKLKESESIDPIIQEAIKKLKERGLSKEVILEVLVKDKRVWDKKMLDQFIKQIETELRITKEEIKQIIKKDMIRAAETEREEKDAFTLKEPEEYSRFNYFVNKIYEKSSEA